MDGVVDDCFLFALRAFEPSSISASSTSSDDDVNAGLLSPMVGELYAELHLFWTNKVQQQCRWRTMNRANDYLVSAVYRHAITHWTKRVYIGAHFSLIMMQLDRVRSSWNCDGIWKDSKLTKSFSSWTSNECRLRFDKDFSESISSLNR